MLYNLRGPVIYPRDLTLIAAWNGDFALGGTSRIAQGFYFITVRPQIMDKHPRSYRSAWRGKGRGREVSDS